MMVFPRARGCNSGGRGLGTPLAGTGVAVALWAKSKGGCTVSATVSVYKVGGDDVGATCSSEGRIWQLTV